MCTDLPLSSPSIFTNASCKDKSGSIPDFVFQASLGIILKNKDCNWINEKPRKIDLCKIVEVNNHCEQTCDMCSEYYSNYLKV